MQDALGSADAQTMQAVPNMLEIVPRGVNKVSQKLLNFQASAACVQSKASTIRDKPERSCIAAHVAAALANVVMSMLLLVTALVWHAVGGHAAAAEGDETT